MPRGPDDPVILYSRLPVGGTPHAEKIMEGLWLFSSGMSESGRHILGLKAQLYASFDGIPDTFTAIVTAYNAHTGLARELPSQDGLWLN